MIPCKVINSREFFLIFLLTISFQVIIVHPNEETSPEIKLYTELREQCLFRLNITTLHNQTLSNLACMDRCILEKVGILTYDGAFNTENIPTNIRQVAIECNEETKHLERCQRAQSYNLCVFKTVGIKVLAEVCANETSAEIDLEALPKRAMMMNLTDESLSCYNRCMLIKMEKIDAKNKINENLLRIYVDDAAKVREGVAICEEANQQVDECVQAVERERCIMEKLT